MCSTHISLEFSLAAAMIYKWLSCTWYRSNIMHSLWWLKWKKTCLGVLPVCRLNINMSSYWHMNSHYNDKTILLIFMIRNHACKTVFILRQDLALLRALFIIELATLKVKYHTSECMCESTLNTYHDIIWLESLPTTKCMWQIGHVWFYFNDNSFQKGPISLGKI